MGKSKRLDFVTGVPVVVWPDPEMRRHGGDKDKRWRKAEA